MVHDEIEGLAEVLLPSAINANFLGCRHYFLAFMFTTSATQILEVTLTLAHH
jgi:hypothetical protein